MSWKHEKNFLFLNLSPTMQGIFGPVGVSVLQNIFFFVNDALYLVPNSQRTLQTEIKARNEHSIR